MAQWTTTDEAAGSPSWANTTLNVTKNQTELFLNTTAEAVIANVAVGVFGVSAAEMNSANTSSEASAVTHTGWQLRTEGTGGRAGRVHYETLVAGGITGDAADDAVLPEA
jgi:hypothetical protein